MGDTVTTRAPVPTARAVYAGGSLTTLTLLPGTAWVVEEARERRGADNRRLQSEYVLRVRLYPGDYRIARREGRLRRA